MHYLLALRHPLHCSVKQCRHITTTAAKSVLGFKKDSKPTIKELRHSYFEAAKQCHPDMKRQNEDGETVHVVLDFRDITEAYEHLLNGNHVRDGEDFLISLDEEDHYRQACLVVLGISADIVEESKQNPMFRHWLDGNTDGAQHWRAFFAVHGGLAQKLRPPDGYLETKQGPSKSETRPKRLRR
jgi:hypothetical protein